MNPEPFDPPQYVQLPSSQNLTLEELAQAWEFLSQLANPLHPLLKPPRNLRRLSPLDWGALNHLLALELELKRHRSVH